MTIDLSPEGRKRLRELRDESPGTWRWACCYQRHDGTHWGIKSDADPIRVVGLGLVSIATEAYGLEKYPTAVMKLAAEAVNALIPLLDALEAAEAQRDNLNVKCGQLHDCYTEVCAERDAALARAHCAELMMQEELDKAGEAYCAALARANAAEASREEYARRVASAAVSDTIERVAGGYTHTEGNAEWVELRVTRALAECTTEPLPEPKKWGTADEGR